MSRRSLLALAASAATAQTRSGELHRLSAVELQRLLRKKQLSARELLDAHLRRIEQLNPKLNAIVNLVPDIARAAAARADEAAARGRFLGPLHGLPTAHKDLRETRGIPPPVGSPRFKGHGPPVNAPRGERLPATGAGRRAPIGFVH